MEVLKVEAIVVAEMRKGRYVRVAPHDLNVYDSTFDHAIDTQTHQRIMYDNTSETPIWLGTMKAEFDPATKRIREYTIITHEEISLQSFVVAFYDQFMKEIAQ